MYDLLLNMWGKDPLSLLPLILETILKPGRLMKFQTTLAAPSAFYLLSALSPFCLQDPLG